MNPNDSKTTVTFRNHVMPDPAASQKAGRPIFSESEVCDIVFAANTKTKATFPAHEAEPNATRESVKEGGGVITYAMMYNEQYRAFKAGTTQPLGGTPLSEAPFLTEAKRRELKALNIHTVEALADLDGPALKQLGMGGRELKNQATAYIRSADGSANATALAAENVSLREQMAELQAQISAISTARATIRNGFTDSASVSQEQTEEQPDGDADENEPEASEIEPDAATDFSKWDDDKLKDYISQITGSRPRGNPSHNTLVAAAAELANG